ncbi:hypothetical protein [Clostridium sp. 'White wine YQ']|uniref:hypothetical protein n=1 Tax=Clostridium sp. 'White wine YQ' TaxID=3027474 RepID=UPI0023655049|nr:hypothetical protein [Clostridium sp. 'White wine YQ']MDD7794286.1 hypothetical protein [Clostridium sp. 'White wine YQ']
MNYYFGFSFYGLIIFLLPMIPNLFYFIRPVPYTLGNNENKHVMLDIIENICRVLFFSMLILVVSRQAIEVHSTYIILIAIMLLLYDVFWGFFFIGKVNLIIILGLAIFPVAYFILAEIWLYNYFAIIPTGLFGIVHVLISYRDYEFNKKEH